MGTLTRLLTILFACFAFTMAAAPDVLASDPETPPESALQSVTGKVHSVTSNGAGVVTEFSVKPDGGDPVPMKVNSGSVEFTTQLNNLKASGTEVTANYKPGNPNIYMGMTS